MAGVSTKNIETIGYVVHKYKEDFKLESIVLDDIQDNEVLVDMKYSGICHTVRFLTNIVPTTKCAHQPRI